MKVHSMTGKQWRIFSTACLIMLTACEGKPVPLTEITFKKDAAIGGTIEVEAADQRLGPPARIQLDENNPSTVTRIAEVFSNKILVKLESFRRSNLPAGASARLATIQVEIKLSGDKNGGRIEAEVKDSKVWLNGEQTSGGGTISCGNLFSVRGENRKLEISFLGFRSLSDCVGKYVGTSDPMTIGTRNVSVGKNDYTEAQDLAMGNEYAAQFISENAGSILSADHPATVYAQQMMNHIAEASDRPDIRPSVHVINADVLNAFALPGGNVFVFRGLIESSRSEAEVVGVLGHEWGHVTARHGTKNMTKARSTMKKMLIGALIGIGINLAGQIDDNIWLRVIGEATTKLSINGGVLYMLQKGRDAEHEADRIGSQYAWKINFEPWGLSDMFTVFMGRYGDNRAEEMYASHPALSNRIANILNLSAFFYPTKPTYIHTTPDFENMKSVLARLPRPVQSESVRVGNAFADNVQKKTDAEIQKYANSNKAKIQTAAALAQIAGGLIRQGDGDSDEDESGGTPPAPAGN